MIEGVEPGSYVVVGYWYWLAGASFVRAPWAGWTAASACGLGAGCVDHTLLRVDIRPGESSGRVYPNDSSVARDFSPP